MYDRILLPTDGSDPTDNALFNAIALAQRFGSTIHVLYVIDSSVITSEIGTTAVIEEFKARGERIVEDVATRIRQEADIPVQTAVKRGIPHREILEYSDETDIDLVVMGTHGRTGIDRVLLGSVTEKVVRLSEVPVVTVRPTISD